MPGGTRSSLNLEAVRKGPPGPQILHGGPRPADSSFPDVSPPEPPLHTLRSFQAPSWKLTTHGKALREGKD